MVWPSLFPLRLAESHLRAVPSRGSEAGMSRAVANHDGPAV